MKQMNLTTLKAKLQVFISTSCLLVVGSGFLGWGQSTQALAQGPAAAEYQVGGLIENGFFGDPKGWTLTRFVVEKDQWIHLKVEPPGPGRATTPFLGPDGFYKIRVQYYDEGDGVSRASVLVGGRAVGSWAFDGILIDGFRWKEFDGVEIKKGDEIALTGNAGGYEYARIRGIEILPSKPLPVAAAAAEIENVEYSQDLVPLSGGAAQAGPEYLLAPNRFFDGGAGTHLVYLKKGQVVPLVARTAFAGQKVSVQYSLTRQGATEPVAAETLISEGIHPIHIPLRAADEGVYELTVGAAPGVQQTGLIIQFDAPSVRSPVADEGYFFVPKGTKAFSIRTSGHTVLLDASGKVMLDQLFDNQAVHNVEVPAGSDNQVWYFQGQIRQLTGVPPYVAARRDAMLTPKEVLQ